MTQNKQTNDMIQPVKNDKASKYLLVIACSLCAVSLLIATFLLGQRSTDKLQNVPPKTETITYQMEETPNQASAYEEIIMTSDTMPTEPETISVPTQTETELPTTVPEPIYENRSLASCIVLKTTNEPGSTTDVTFGDWEDSSGKKRNNSVRFWVVDRPGWSNTEYAIFDISSGYERVSGIVAAEVNSEKNAEMYIRIYVDDILKYTSDRITLQTPPEWFEIDISEGERLTVECITSSSSFGYSVVDANVSKQIN